MLIIGLYRATLGIILAATGFVDISAGIYGATIGAAIIGITLGSYRKAEKWSWWCLLVVGLVPPLNCTILHGVSPGVVVDWILFVPAIAFPAKAILSKKST